MNRRRLTRRSRKKTRKIIAISAICLLGLMTAGYAAMQTSLEIKAKGNIIKKSSAGSELVEQVGTVTSGDGLYADTYEKGRYVYKGANPNNYVTFNDELWRIISVENDGTIKIMRAENIDDRAWDSSNSNNWVTSSLNTYLNEEYLSTLSDSNKIVSHNYSIGAVTHNNNDLETQITHEDETIWNGKVGLITGSDYLKANSNTSLCGTFSLNNSNNNICLKTNWMYSAVPSNDYLWTISPQASNSHSVVDVDYDGGFIVTSPAYSSFGVVPVLYLSSEITITSGSGQENDPFQITI